MVVGTLMVRLLLRDSRSLKDKRQVIQSIKGKIRNQFNVSIAEVDENDNRQLAVLGLAMVSNAAHPIKTELGKIVEALRVHPVAELVDYQLEV